MSTAFLHNFPKNFSLHRQVRHFGEKSIKRAENFDLERLLEPRNTRNTQKCTTCGSPAHTGQQFFRPARHASRITFYVSARSSRCQSISSDACLSQSCARSDIAPRLAIRVGSIPSSAARASRRRRNSISGASLPRSIAGPGRAGCADGVRGELSARARRRA